MGIGISEIATIIVSKIFQPSLKNFSFFSSAKNLTEISDGDLLETLNDAKEELFNLRFQLVTGQLDNYSRIKEVKKEVARAMTELRVREIAAAEALEETND